MSESLKDQLRALGLTPKQPRRKDKKSHKQRKPKAFKPKDGSDISLDQAYRMRIQQDRQQKEQAAARKREQERQRLQINQKIKAVIKEFEVRDKNADVKRNFLYKGRIRSVLTTAEQLREINAGQLAVVYLRGNYHLIPADKAADIQKFAPEHIPDLQGSHNEDEEDHPVPDDLIW